MSDHMMSVEEARECLEVLDVVLMPREVQKIAARTIVHQAEQIERLRAALRQADKDAFWASADRYVGPGPLTYEEPDWATYNLHPGDMESTDE